MNSRLHHHRSRKYVREHSPFLPIPRPSKEIISEATKLLTFCCVYERLASEMPTSNEVVEAMLRRMEFEQNRVGEAKVEMEKLADSYNRYVDLLAEIEDRRKRIERIAAVLGPFQFSFFKTGIPDTILPDDCKFPVRETEASADQLRKDLALWQAVEQFLLHAKEARVGDIQSFLKAVSMGGVSRQAIESAVKAHPRVFKTVKRGSERYITLRSRD
jgi:hypothetical protein